MKCIPNKRIKARELARTINNGLLSLRSISVTHCQFAAYAGVRCYVWIR